MSSSSSLAVSFPPFSSLFFLQCAGDEKEKVSLSFSIGNPVIVNTASLYTLVGCAGNLAQFPKLPTSADIAFPFAEAYELNDRSAVAEFVPDEAIPLPLWDNDDSEELYRQIVEYMK